MFLFVAEWPICLRCVQELFSLLHRRAELKLGSDVHTDSLGEVALPVLPGLRNFLAVHLVGFLGFVWALGRLGFSFHLNPSPPWSTSSEGSLTMFCGHLWLRSILVPFGRTKSLRSFSQALRLVLPWSSPDRLVFWSPWVPYLGLLGSPCASVRPSVSLSLSLSPATLLKREHRGHITRTYYFLFGGERCWDVYLEMSFWDSPAIRFARSKSGPRYFCSYQATTQLPHQNH